MLHGSLNLACPVLLGLASRGLTAAVPRQASPPSFAVQFSGATLNRASDPVDPAFPGFAFEQASFVRYAENDEGTANVFSNNLIEEITSRTGGHPIIRLGGTSPDYARYLPGQKEPALPVAEQDNYQNVGFTTIGPAFWDLTKNFPDATYMVQVPLATTNISETVAWSRSAVDRIGIDRIHSIQPGNEPDLYHDNYRGEGEVFLGPPKYQGTLNNVTYVGNYTRYVKRILQEVKLPQNRFFTAFDIASHEGNYNASAWTFDLETTFGLGIDAESIIKEVSHHYYENRAGGAEELESGLMDMRKTHRHLGALQPRINWLKENRPDIPFILNEVGNSLNPENSYEYQNRLGSTLWQVDFYLYALQMGVARINYQQIMHAGYNLWLPVGSAGHRAQVFANYYSQPFIADFIGSSGKTRVAKLDTDEDAQPNLAAYIAYEDNTPRRLAIANLDYWNRTSSGTERPSTALSFKPPSGKSVKVFRLHSPDGAGADATSITYGGSQWTHDSRGREVKGVRDDREELQPKDGVVVVNVPASEAVLVWL